MKLKRKHNDILTHSKQEYEYNNHSNRHYLNLNLKAYQAYEEDI